MLTHVQLRSCTREINVKGIVCEPCSRPSHLGLEDNYPPAGVIEVNTTHHGGVVGEGAVTFIDYNSKFIT